jgi:hypothetical protein
VSSLLTQRHRARWNMSLRRSLVLTIIFSVTAMSAAMGKTMVHSMNDNNPLSGVTVLVVEDDLF